MSFPSIYQLLNIVGYGIGTLSFLFLLNYLGFDMARVRSRIRITKQLKTKAFMEQNWEKYKWLRIYHHLLSATIPKYHTQYFLNILLWQLVSFVSLSIINYSMMGSWRFSIFASFFFTWFLPILMLWIKLKFMQKNAQQHLLDATIILLQSYRRNDKNMLYALKDVSLELDGELKAFFQKLFARMHGTDAEKRLATETFAFAIGRNWGKNLAIYILKSVQDGFDVSLVLKNMIRDLTEFRKRVRDIQTEGSEVALLGYVPIPATLLFIVLDAEFLIPTGNAYYYHFGTSLGFQTFLFSMMVGAINLILAFLLANPKQGL